MKRIFLLLSALFIGAFSLSAQKVGYINMETVLKALPEYNQAQEQIKEMGDRYKQEIDSELAELEKMYNSYQSQKSYLSESMRQARENEIILRERNMKERQNSYFGQDGLLAKESKKLMDPINLRIQTELENFARENGYSLIIDIASNSGVVYKNDNDDLSAKIIERLK